MHIWALHIPGSNNPTGVNIKGPQDTVPFHPFYTTKMAGFGTIPDFLYRYDVLPQRIGPYG
jgi:quinol-cytochrome oxidoreductase complex cytochrome b subunit